MIQSSSETAEKIATGMGNASDSIQMATSKKIAKTRQTTLVVNEKAQNTNEEAVKLAQLFHASFKETIQNIQSVANEFERLDKELGKSMNLLNAIPNHLEDMYTYNKAKNG